MARSGPLAAGITEQLTQAGTVQAASNETHENGSQRVVFSRGGMGASRFARLPAQACQALRHSGQNPAVGRFKQERLRKDRQPVGQ